MKTAKTDRNEVRENTLCILLTPPEKKKVETKARSVGLSMSAWARMVLVREVNKGE